MGLYLTTERDFKATQLRKNLEAYDLILVGNSKTAIINTREIEYKNVFNAGIGGAKVEELYYLIGRYINKPIPVIIGLDLGQCDTLSTDAQISFRDSPGSTLHSDADCLITARAISHSLKCIKKYINKEPKSVLDSGTRNFKVLDPENEKIAQARLKKLTERFYKNSDSFNARMIHLNALKEVLEQRKIPYITFIYPLNEKLYRSLEKNPQYPLLLEWKKIIKEIFPEIVDLSIAEYSLEKDYYKMDPEHYKPYIGSRYINEKLLPLLNQYR